MSDLIRRLSGLTPRAEAVTRATTGALARMAHEAEDANDDVTLCDVWAEIEERERRTPGAYQVFADLYREQQAERARQRRAV